MHRWCVATDVAIPTAELFRQHARFVARFLVRYGADQSSVEDLIQDVFLVAHAHGGYHPGPAKPTSWLGAIAMRLATTHRRKVRLRRHAHTGGDVDDRASDVPTPEVRCDIDARMQQLHRALQQLPPEHRTTFILFELEGESCASIAAAMEVPVGTIHSRLHVARRRLREAIAREAHDAKDIAPTEARYG